jgi:hypothetical protein
MDGIHCDLYGMRWNNSVTWTHDWDLSSPFWAPIDMIVSLDLQGDIVALTVGARHVELQQHNEVRRHHGS